MIYNKLVVALALSAGLLDVTFAKKGGAGSGTASSSVASTTTAAAASTSVAASTNTTSNANSADLQLNPANVQSGSNQNGQQVQEAGQVASNTDPANFINFCTGKTLTNGLQVTSGSCNGIVMGDIPSNTAMISSIITNPGPGENLNANTDFTINVQVNNLVAGSFSNADTTYYSAPQALQGGKVVGHTHVTVQSIGTLDTPTPPDPATFSFFKGINDAGNGNGGLSAAVAGGLPAGVYRVCTMTSSTNHQPVLMPVAQRGAQDDCQKFTVGGTGASTNTTNTGATAGTAASSTASASTSTTSASTTTAAATTAAAGGAKKVGKGGRAGKFVRREFIV